MIGLKVQCPSVFVNETKKNVLKRIASGLAPTTGQHRDKEGLMRQAMCRAEWAKHKNRDFSGFHKPAAPLAQDSGSGPELQTEIREWKCSLNKGCAMSTQDSSQRGMTGACIDISPSTNVRESQGRSESSTRTSPYTNAYDLRAPDLQSIVEDMRSTSGGLWEENEFEDVFWHGSME